MPTRSYYGTIHLLTISGSGDVESNALYDYTLRGCCKHSPGLLETFSMSATPYIIQLYVGDCRVGARKANCVGNGLQLVHSVFLSILQP